MFVLLDYKTNEKSFNCFFLLNFSLKLLYGYLVEILSLKKFDSLNFYNCK
jgi:hypothetical protein